MTREDKDQEIEQQAKLNRRFDLNSLMAEKMGGLGGSPVSRQKQIMLELSQFIDRELDDVYGALKIVLKRRVDTAKVIIGENMENPSFVLKSIISQILEKDQNLYDFVKKVDAEYGRMYQERPIFQTPGAEAQSGDVYTHDSVRKILEEFKSEII